MTRDSSQPDELLIDRYLAGELSGEERAAVEAWLREHPATAARLQQLPQVVRGSGVPDTEASWRQLEARLRSSDDLAERRARRAPDTAGAAVSAARFPLRRIAAAAAIVITGAAALMLRRDAVTEYRAAAALGRDTTVTLVDGTTVRLAPGSAIVWTSAFGRPARDIRLDGEALFDVVHDERRPFRVRTRNAIAEDIGTRFVVRAWPELRHVEVAVAEGEVALSDTAARAGRGQAQVLRAGDRARLLDDGAVAVSRDADLVLAWTSGALAFDNESLRTVLPAIGRRFAVAVRADSTVLDRRITARFTAQSLSDVISALALTLNVRADSVDGVLTLHPVVK
jgi:transmembrane sensor